MKNDLEIPSVKMSSDLNMPTGLGIRGINLPIGSLKMSVALDGELNNPLCLAQINKMWFNLLKSLNLYPEDGTYITLGDHSMPSITVTYYVPKKIQEKNGVL